MPSKLRQGCCILANFLVACAIFIFGLGFFPHKAFLPGLSTWQPDVATARPPSPFNKVIFMVVDALRSDFVFGNASSFSFTQSLIRSGAALPFTGHASPPTITMPRVKAITTGSVPSFLDLLLNFAESDTSSTLATQDTWVAQMKAKADGKLAMYGDDTWLRLFPGFFDRSDGTTSFFVSDFTEVDNNVTRHVPGELKRDDWNAIILHFLGLDHIGHKTGPRGPNMPAKQQEMDGIVKMIYESMESQAHLESSLLVLLGDHGMNEAGNHGASSAGEVSTALTFISPKFKDMFPGHICPQMYVDDFEYFERVEQSDVAPTLAALLGFPIPRNNLGVLIPQILDMWKTEADQLALLFENALQMHEVAQATYPDAFSSHPFIQPCGKITHDVERLACEWKDANSAYEETKSGKANSKEAKALIFAFLRSAQRTLSGTASNYHLGRMHFGTVLAVFAVLLASIAARADLERSLFSTSVYITVIAAYSFTMFASSYVEEEQQFWYWALSGWLMILLFKQDRLELASGYAQSLSTAGMATLFGIGRHWNQTGQKYAGDPDFVTELVSKHPGLLWTLIFCTYAHNSRNLSSRAWRWLPSKQMSLLPVMISLFGFAFKIAFTAADSPELLTGVVIFRPLLNFANNYPLVNLARVAFLGIMHLFLCALYYEKPWKSSSNRLDFLGTVHDLLTMFLMAQTRTVNIPIFLIYSAQLSLLKRMRHFDILELTLTSLLLQYSSFFMFGGTNAISSVDLSNAYNGVSGYSALAVGILTFVGNWAGPIWWASATCCLIGNALNPRQDSPFSYFALLTLFTTFSTLSVMVACTF